MVTDDFMTAEEIEQVEEYIRLGEAGRLPLDMCHTGSKVLPGYRKYIRHLKAEIEKLEKLRSRLCPTCECRLFHSNACLCSTKDRRSPRAILERIKSAYMDSRRCWPYAETILSDMKETLRRGSHGEDEQE